MYLVSANKECAHPCLHFSQHRVDGGGSLGHDAPANRTRRGGIWEIDFFYASSIINDKKERSYFPYVSLVVDHDSAFIFDFHLEKKVVCKSTFPMKFADFIERIEVIPDELLVNIYEIYRIMEPLSDELGIEINMVESLPALAYVQESMDDFF